MTTFLRGQVIKVSVTLTVEGTPTDPTTLTVMVQRPDRSVTSYQYGTHPEVVRTGPGSYYILVDTEPRAGPWAVRFRATGAAAGAAEVTFEVVPGRFT